MFVRSLIVVLIIGSPLAAQDIKVDFRNKVNEDAFQFEGPNYLNFIKLENDGLRLRFTGGKSPTKPVGVRWPSRIKGDFTITAEYEILQVDRPERGSGVGIEIYVVFATPGTPRDAIAYARLMHPSGGPMYALNYMTNNEKGNRISKDPVRLPTTTKSKQGKLRLVREGTKYMAYAAAADGEFFKVTDEPREIGDMDVLLVRVAGLDGGDPRAELDLRVLEVNIQGKVLDIGGKIALAPPPAPTDALTEGGSGRWTFWVIAVVGVLGVGIFTAIFLVAWLTRRAAAGAKAPTKTAKARTAPGAAAVFLELQCASCSKRLKIKPESAGKLVKCPGCGQSTRAPASSARS
jgi:Protein of unknown function (DUF1583) C domain